MSGFQNPVSDLGTLKGPVLCADCLKRLQGPVVIRDGSLLCQPCAATRLSAQALAVSGCTLLAEAWKCFRLLVQGSQPWWDRRWPAALHPPKPEIGPGREASHPLAPCFTSAPPPMVRETGTRYGVAPAAIHGAPSANRNGPSTTRQLPVLRAKVQVPLEVQAPVPTKRPESCRFSPA